MLTLLGLMLVALAAGQSADKFQQGAGFAAEIADRFASRPNPAEERAAATFDALSKVVGKALKSLDEYRSRLNKKLAAITAQSRGLKLVDADAASLKAIALVLDVQVKTLKYPTPAGKFLRALRRVGRRLNIGSEADRMNRINARSLRIIKRMGYNLRRVTCKVARTRACRGKPGCTRKCPAGLKGKRCTKGKLSFEALFKRSANQPA